MGTTYNQITYIPQSELYHGKPGQYVFIREVNYQMDFCKIAFSKSYRVYSIMLYISILIAIAAVAITIGAILSKTGWSFYLSIWIIAHLYAMWKFMQRYDKQDGDEKESNAVFIQAVACIIAIIGSIVSPDERIISACLVLIPLPLFVEAMGIKAFNKKFWRVCTMTTLYDFIYGKGFYIAERHPSKRYTKLEVNTESAVEAAWAYREGKVKMVP